MSAAEEKILRNLAEQLGHHESQILAILTNSEKECYENSGDDADRYAACMTKHTKKIAKSQNELELRLGFFRHSLAQCLKTKTAEECEASGKVKVDDMFAKFIKNLK